MTQLSDAAVNRLRRLADWPDLAGTRYRALEPIGQGGMGTVYLAEDTALGRQVALKVLRGPVAEAEAAERMAREARVIAQLEHPGIVPIHDVGRLPDGRMFYVMKRIRGRRLDDYCRADSTLSSRLRIFERICETVAFAHARGVVHRDLKPQNIMVGEFGEVLVLDWGLAKLMENAGLNGHCPIGTYEPVRGGIGENESDATSPTRHGVIVGTPMYMSPEQACGDVAAVGACSDVFSLGAILWFLVTGQAPPAADSTPSASVRRLDRAIPKALEAVSMKAMCVSPDGRYASAAEMGAEVARFLGGDRVRAHRETVGEHFVRLAQTHRTAILLVGAYLAVRILLILLPRR